jgi:4-diphosphocytidyl-2-C-methyl-D-erythritol kinase
MISFPKAKINIGLKVVGKRSDGFHDIETIFYPIPLSDALEFVTISGKDSEDELVISGIDIRIRPEKNLIIKAVRRLRTSYPVPMLKIHLHKVIPSGAGLGGGSSDAACILKSIIRRFKFPVSDTELKSIALETGSDCPFFLNPVPSFATGRGEILKPVKNLLEGYHLILMNPGFHISTREAYYNCHSSKPETSLKELFSHKISDWQKYIINDFEDFVFKVYPQVGELKNALYKNGAVYCSMTGSGSSVYGIYNKKPEIPDKLKELLIFEGTL